MEEPAVHDLVGNGVFLVFIFHDGLSLGHLCALSDLPLCDRAFDHGQSRAGHFNLNDAGGRHGAGCGRRGLGRGRRRSAALDQGFVFRLALSHDADRVTDLDRVALLGKNVQDPGGQGFVVDHVLFVFIFHDHVAFADMGTLSSFPSADRAFHHGETGSWHDNFNTHSLMLLRLCGGLNMLLLFKMMRFGQNILRMDATIRLTSGME